MKLAHDSDGSGSAESAPKTESSKLPVVGSRDSSSDQSAAHWFDRVNENVVSQQNKNVKHEGKSRSPAYSQPSLLTRAR